MALSKIKSTSLEPDATNLVLIKTQTVTSSVSAVEFVNGSDGVVFDSTYDIYYCFVSDYITVNDATKCDLEFSFDTGTTYQTTNYRTSAYRNFYGDSGNGSGNNIFNGEIQCLNIQSKQAIATGTTNGVVTFYKPSSQKNPLVKFDFVGYDGDYQINNSGGAAHKTDGDIDAFRFVASSGDIAGGTFSLYGVKNA